MVNRERDTLERAVAGVTEQAAKAAALVDELQVAGLPQGGPVLQAKLIRLELLKVKGDLERELEQWVLDCQRCNRRVHWGRRARGPAGPLGARGARPGPHTESVN
jgi:hypothetical protein